MPAMRSSVSPLSNKQHRAPAQAGRSGEGTRVLPAGVPQSHRPHTGGFRSATREEQGGDPGRGEGARLSTQAALAPQQPPPHHRGGNSRTEERAAGARPESSRPTRAAQGCRQIRAAPQDHRPPRPQTQGEKQEGNEEAGDHIQLKGQENSRKNKATNLFHLTDGESRKEIMKILKTVRRAIDSADSCKQN